MNVFSMPVPTRPDPAIAGQCLVRRGDLLLRSFRCNDADTVRFQAREYLRLAQANPHGNSFGNAVHQANTILGLLALEENRIDHAVEYLNAAASTPGSSQLRGFGPNMLLAQKLLVAGRTRAVLRYLDRCGKFWKLSFGRLWLWKVAIRSGRVPDFGANLSHLLDPKSFG
ncbi:hypothetical protein [Lewinella sp. JB7]|uniref:hypothetical protein n=1 Tax=Lewinella sp. JB7 TaxID=2962887 RepID=UPI0020CA2312|nr:hypothetical protein [Lewinella sp. JB7]MCP9237639.1 hypothetical protein [Lewinella sp. JB7]